MDQAWSDGICDAHFEPVREAFADNFAHRGETGAALCICADGRVVVDLWGGSTGQVAPRRWGPNTLVNFFSVGKGMLALLAARLAGDGRLDTDAPVATYWPEFAAGGKQDVTVRQLLSHQAGLPAVRRPLPEGAMLDWALMTGELAAQAPWWPPGSAHGYHVNTFGFLVGEVLRRASGRTVGDLLRAEVCGPLGADVYVGLPPGEHYRVAEFAWPGLPEQRQDLAGLADEALMEHNAYFNPLGLSGAGVVNSAAWRQAELPSTNGHGSARGVARLYAAIAAGGTLEGIRVAPAGALADAATEQVYGDDLILHRASRFGLGFQLTQPERPIGPNAGAFGHFGAGGSLGFCDPQAGVGFGYVVGRMGPRWQNPANRALLEALYSCL
jgi:CubicO group peptidase (beta-lactamase class C family)